MDCKFRILTKDKKTFEKLKEYAEGWSEKGLIIIDKKCDFFEFLKDFDIEILITPFRAGEGIIDCFYVDGKIQECNKKILDKFNMTKFEPIIWKTMNNNDIPF